MFYITVQQQRIKKIFYEINNQDIRKSNFTSCITKFLIVVCIYIFSLCEYKAVLIKNVYLFVKMNC